MPTLSRRTGNVVAAVLALALTAGLVIRTSSAVFTASTDNNGNSLAAGTIVLTDDDGGATAILDMSNIAPGEFSQDCIEVAYTGTLDPEAVKVFSSSSFATTPATTGPGTAAVAMQDQVRITIEEGAAGSGGDFRDCTGFAAGTTLVDRELLTSWHGAATDYASGDGGWDPTGPGQTRAYRVTLELDLGAGNEFQGAALSGINLTWATRSTATPGLVP